MKYKQSRSVSSDSICVGCLQKKDSGSLPIMLAFFSIFIIGFSFGWTSYIKEPICEGVCVEPRLCINGKLNIYGEKNLTPRSGAQCRARYEVCCSDGNEALNSCGVRNIKGIDKTKRTDQGSKFGEFPWMLVLSGRIFGNYYGGASLIHPKIALTAAHIVNAVDINEIEVRAGEWAIGDTSVPISYKTSTVSEKVIHEKFNSENLRFDIALLFLSEPFDLAPHINTVCLPPPNYDFGLITCYATVWDVEDMSPSTPSYLKKIALPIEPNYSCEDFLRQTKLTRFFKLHKSFMCAGGEHGKDTCEGHGGSPLVCRIPGKNAKYYLAGMVAWGMDCEKEDLPGVYTNVAYLRLWVDEKLAARNINSSFYTN